MIRVAIAQINSTVGDLSGNLHKIKSSIGVAHAKRADLIIFPEMTICGYPPEDLLYKSHFIHDNLKVLRSIEKIVKDFTVVVGFVDMDKQKRLYNAAAVISQGRCRGVYHKVALPNYGVFDEYRYFEKGIKKPVFEINQNSLGISICEDIWVDNVVSMKDVKQNISILVNISCSPYDTGKLSQREQLLKKRAKEGQCFICYANLVGGQDELVFDGGSLILDPNGRTIAAAKQFEEDLVFADIEVSASKRKSIINKKYIKVFGSDGNDKVKITTRHNKPKNSKTERVYKALVLGTRDYVVKNGFDKVVIGLSGGIDSALVASIAVDALGKENVIGVTMPSKFSSKGTKQDAFQLAENLGIKILQIPIGGICQAYDDALRHEFEGTSVGVAEENIQARARGNLLMALSNKYGWLVLTTGNKSEFAVGYCTLYGDMSGGFAVIKDVPKTLVYCLSAHVNNDGAIRIPKSIIERAPSAELREGQADQDSLPPYDILDSILEQYVEEHKSFHKIAGIQHKKIAKEVIPLVDKSEYKRRQSPPGIKITQRAFGKDWRLPITNKYKET